MEKKKQKTKNVSMREHLCTGKEGADLFVFSNIILIETHKIGISSSLHQ